MNNEFEKIIEKYFGDIIIKWSLQKSEVFYDQDAFGNELVTYTGDGFKFRLIKDRSQVFLEFYSSRKSKDWIDMIDVFCKIKGNVKSGIQYNYFNTISNTKRVECQVQHIAASLKPYWSEIILYLQSM